MPEVSVSKSIDKAVVYGFTVEIYTGRHLRTEHREPMEILSPIPARAKSINVDFTRLNLIGEYNKGNSLWEISDRTEADSETKTSRLPYIHVHIGQFKAKFLIHYDGRVFINEDQHVFRDYLRELKNEIRELNEAYHGNLDKLVRKTS